MTADEERALRAELAIVEARIDRAYWAFSRTKRAKPPILVVPEAYRRRREIEAILFPRGIR